MYNLFRRELPHDFPTVCQIESIFNVRQYQDAMFAGPSRLERKSWRYSDSPPLSISSHNSPFRTACSRSFPVASAGLGTGSSRSIPTRFRYNDCDNSPAWYCTCQHLTYRNMFNNLHLLLYINYNDRDDTKIEKVPFLLE